MTTTDASVAVPPLEAMTPLAEVPEVLTVNALPALIVEVAPLARRPSADAAPVVTDPPDKVAVPPWVPVPISAWTPVAFAPVVEICDPVSVSEPPLVAYAPIALTPVVLTTVPPVDVIDEPEPVASIPCALRPVVAT